MVKVVSVASLLCYCQVDVDDLRNSNSTKTDRFFCCSSTFLVRKMGNHCCSIVMASSRSLLSCHSHRCHYSRSNAVTFAKTLRD